MAELWVPDAVREAYETGATAGPLGSAHTLVVNETELPDDLVKEAAADFWVENASLSGVQSTFQTYVNDGSMLARHRYRTPTTVIEEMKLARDMAERDDDIRGVIGGIMALAFDHFEHYAKDEKTAKTYTRWAAEANLAQVFKEMMREWLITSSLHTVTLFTPFELDVEDDASEATVNIIAPRIGVLPAENVRVVGSDLFGNAPLAYWPGDDAKLAKWLAEFFSDRTSAARRAAMRREDPISAALFTGPVKVDNQQSMMPSFTNAGFTAYGLNPQMVQRSTMPKGFWPYPRPLMTSNFGLLEAKRLLNIMDFALLQGAANYVIVAKKGTDERPALPQEVTQLRELVRHMGRTGVIVGDHRLSFDILTPNLDDMLNPAKRNLIGRKIAMAMLRKPENVTLDGASQAAAAETEWITRVIESDRGDIIRHAEEKVYPLIRKRNPDVIKGAARVWAPKIILQGTQFFTDLVLKLRDRGDIPRKYGVQAAGFNFDAAVAEREREREAGVDEIMTPAAVPFTDPGSPQDNNEGRPTGASSNNGRGNMPSSGSRSVDGTRPARTITRNAGETVKAWKEEGLGMVRMGELTRALLKQYEDTAEFGRVTAFEERALQSGQPATEGPIAVIPVNPGFEVEDLRVVRLVTGLSVFIGSRISDGALVAKALGFREPEYAPLEAQETAMRYGFDVDVPVRPALPAPAPEPEEHAQRETQPAPVIVVEREGLFRTVVERDEHGNITGSRREPLAAE